MEILDRWQLLVDTYMLLLELFEELKVCQFISRKSFY